SQQPVGDHGRHRADEPTGRPNDDQERDHPTPKRGHAARPHRIQAAAPVPPDLRTPRIGTPSIANHPAYDVSQPVPCRRLRATHQHRQPGPQCGTTEREVYIASAFWSNRSTQYTPPADSPPPPTRQASPYGMPTRIRTGLA